MTATRPLVSAAGVTPAWLTEVLARRESLAGSNVAHVVVESTSDTLLSATAKLRVTYAPTAPASAPRRLFLKMSKAGVERPFGAKKEAAFYGTVAPAMTDPPVPRCYDALFDEATGRFHVLLEDLSETHCVPTTWPLPPDFDVCERIVDAWARFHAGWWRSSRLGNGIGERFNVDSYSAFVAKEFPRFIDSLGDRLSSERRERCERMVAAAGQIAARNWAAGSLTLCHGDAHVWNVLCPMKGVTGVVNIIDWDNWRPAPGARDLAYMIAVHWYPERRQRFERKLLFRYRRELEAQGVAGYDMEALGRDYRLAVISSIGTPLSQAAAGLPPLIWWGHLERIMLAYEDLDCEELMSAF
jgi:hypothetical protein